jgi:hypothetical protein
VNRDTPGHLACPNPVDVTPFPSAEPEYICGCLPDQDRSARPPGTGELGAWTPEVLRVVDVLRNLDWTGFDPTSLDDLAEIAGAVVGGLFPPPPVTLSSPE